MGSPRGNSRTLAACTLGRCRLALVRSASNCLQLAEVHPGRQAALIGGPFDGLSAAVRGSPRPIASRPVRRPPAVGNRLPCRKDVPPARRRPSAAARAMATWEPGRERRRRCAAGHWGYAARWNLCRRRASPVVPGRRRAMPAVQRTDQTQRPVPYREAQSADVGWGADWESAIESSIAVKKLG